MDLGIIEANSKLQSGLSKAQAFPVLGPAIASPIKLTCGIVQLIAGTFFGSLGSLSAMLASPNSRLSDYGFSALKNGSHLAAIGGQGIAYSVINMLTLGILGFLVERS